MVLAVAVILGACQSTDSRLTRGQARDAAMLFATTFDEAVFGGSDNSRQVAPAVVRSGPFLLGAIVAESGQALGRRSTESLARRLSLAALARTIR